MSKRTSPLDYVTVAAPCNVGWDNMIGDERVRFCGQCNLNVYNLSAMTKQSAERLITQTEGRLCVRYYRRADGTILTRNCPVGLRALKRRLSRIATASVSAVISFFAGILAVTGLRERPLSPVAAPRVLIKANVDLPKTSPETPPIMGTYAAPDYVEGQMIIGDTLITDYRGTLEERVIRERPAKISRKKR
jgi:hypothetical protein